MTTPEGDFMKTIDVIGCSGNVFSREGADALNKAEIIVGSKRLLEENELPGDAEKVIVDGSILGILPRLVTRSKTRKMVFLASGDPLYCGIGATLLRFVPPKRLRFYPGVTAFQQLFVALGQPWEKTRLFSLHARKKELPYREILRAPLCAVYGDAGRPAAKIAQELIQAFPAASRRPAAAGCNLSFPEEKVIRGTLSQIAKSAEATVSLSVLALLPEDNAAVPPLPLGLPDEHYSHFRNMITHPEIRAIVLSKLRLVPGVLWDLGAGSGSIGIEAGGLCSGLEVHAVEKDPERHRELRNNIEAEGIPNLAACLGNAEDLLDKLPPPNRIFIGGGGRELLEKSFEHLLPGGILVMTGVMVETVSLMGSTLTDYRTEFLTVNISRSMEITTGGFMFRAENPIAIAVYARPEKGSRA